jgi:DnaK suppressor protein
MSMTKTVKRNADLRQMLSARRLELLNDVQGRIRDGRSAREMGDEVERSDEQRQEDMELALLQMRAETLVRIDEAIGRLEAGEYGSCFDCGSEIAEPRLRALPFAVRCRACEETREEEQGRRERATDVSRAERRSTASY